MATVALAKEEDWSYHLPTSEAPPATVALSLDGTCLLMCEEGWRETMVGTISFYDRRGERQHTIYLAATPEYGKATFLDRMEREIGRVKAAYPQAHGESPRSANTRSAMAICWSLDARSALWTTVAIR